MDSHEFARHADDNCEFLFMSGSHAYGTNHSGSDIDRRGIFSPSYAAMLNPFSGINKTTVDLPWEEDTRLWEISFFMLKAQRSQEMLDALFVDESMWLSEPSPRIRLLMDHRDTFVTSELINSLKGHVRRNLFRLKDQFADNTSLDAPDKADQLDFLFCDPNLTIPVRKMPLFSLHGEHAFRLYRQKSWNGKGDVVPLMLALHTGSDLKSGLVNENGELVIRKGRTLGNCREVFYDRRGFRELNKMLNDRSAAAEQHSKRIARSKKFGLDTKLAATSIRQARLAKELLETGVFTVRRHDADELRDIALGRTRTPECLINELSRLEYEIHQKQSLTLPKAPDPEQMSGLYEAVMSLPTGAQSRRAG